MGQQIPNHKLRHFDFLTPRQKKKKKDFLAQEDITAATTIAV